MAAVVARAPATVAGHPVRVVVVDDGSRDGTADRAAAAGAEVVSIGANRGLGAAVRRGLAEAVAPGAAAVAFCDADGEYAPEELGVGRRADPRGRRPTTSSARASPGASSTCARTGALGNVVLTAPAVGRSPGRRITDGQSGYRALSRAAAADAEIIHDFNYAQVLTLDLLARGTATPRCPSATGSATTGGRSCGCGRTCAGSRPAVLPRAQRAQSSTTWPRSRPRARAQASWSKEPSRAEAVGGGPGHGEGVVGVVVHEQGLAAEREQGGLLAAQPRATRGRASKPGAYTG